MSASQIAATAIRQRPILLVGAGRSGTNLVSMALGASDKLANVYEQRYVWTYGMAAGSDDVRAAESANDKVCRYIRAHFAKQAGQFDHDVRVIDKTPANALRLGFCLKVFPDAQVINILRNPYDNVASRIVELQKAGQALEGGDDATRNSSRGSVLGLRLRHARDLISRGNLPVDRIPYAVADQLPEKLRILFRGSAAQYAERVPGMREVAGKSGPIAALCHQWLQLVGQSTTEGRQLPEGSYLEIRYEDVVQRPRETGENLTAFVGLEDPSPVIDYLVDNARPETVGNWHRRLSQAQIEEVNGYLRGKIEDLCYDAADPAELTNAKAKGNEAQ